MKTAALMLASLVGLIQAASTCTFAVQKYSDSGCNSQTDTDNYVFDVGVCEFITGTPYSIYIHTCDYDNQFVSFSVYST